jgi:3-hydroxybutyryl-CoA dehydrogenase
MAREIRNVGVVGLGTMGAGIAQVAVEAGFETIGRELSADVGEQAKARVDHFLARKVEKGQLPQEEKDAAIGRLSLTTDLADLADCDLVIEAAFEDLSVKHEVFAALEDAVAPDAILATNTSALSVTEIAAGAQHPERVVGMHFFNPAPLMKLVEIVRAERTADDVFEAAYGFAQRLGKEPVRCNDTPGFVVNRILIPLLNDCVRVLDEAGVTVEDLDKAMRYGAGWPMGPATLLDLVGADIHVHASEALYEKLREPRMAPPARLVRMANAGKLGRKTREGFYRYDD